MIYPANILVTTPTKDGLEALWADPDLARFVNLAPCEEDERPLQLLFTLPRVMGDSAVAEHIGGLATLTTQKATLGQLVREVNLARGGEKGIFKKGRCYVLYLEGCDGSLVAVFVFWRAGIGEWDVLCYRFDQGGEWSEGYEVYGN